MDGTTEPIIAVIGHPIAGNPSQLAIERAIAYLQLEWRVLSFDVPVDDVDVALQGLAVLSIRGVLIDPSVGPAAAKWYADQLACPTGKTADQGGVDCLARNDQGDFVASDQRQRFIETFFESMKPGQVVFIGDPLADLGSSSRQRWLERLRQYAETENLLLDHEELDREAWSGIKRVVVHDGGEIHDEDGDLEQTLAQWFSQVETGKMIDLSSPLPRASQLDGDSMNVLRCLDLQSIWLQRCMQVWTGENVPLDVITEAIEEYTGF